jgi:glycosyltransferase involved in cell wall biosynthesis
MKILWLCNQSTPDIASDLGDTAHAGGGWITSLYDMLTQKNDLSLLYLFPFKVEDSVVGNAKADYFGFAIKRGKPCHYNKKLEQVFYDYLIKTQPDVIHLFGSEFAHHLAMSKAAKKANMQNRVLVSVQGLISYIAKHYTDGLDEKTIKSWTFRDLLRMDNISRQKKSFEKRGVFEVSTLKNVKHIAGRTTWDRACIHQINRQAKYHYLGETLRSSFYDNCWDIANIKRHSIFISTAQYPVKGAHYMIKALKLIKQNYPDVHLYISGLKLDSLNGLKGKLRLSSYPKYILSLISKLGLNNSVTFLGYLDEQKMVTQYLSSHVFVCPSVIENSPNSLGEAMLTGVPCVSADVGGVSSMMTHNEDGFVYQCTAEYMLAHYVCEIFKDDKSALALSNSARAHAQQTHDQNINMEKTLVIYNEIDMENKNG